MYESKKWGFELELKPLPIMPNQTHFFYSYSWNCSNYWFRSSYYLVITKGRNPLPENSARLHGCNQCHLYHLESDDNELVSIGGNRSWKSREKEGWLCIKEHEYPTVSWGIFIQALVVKDWDSIYRPSKSSESPGIKGWWHYWLKNSAIAHNKRNMREK